nr:MAG TPA: hypothetical protein [Caudoviricetes sp.]
MAIPLHLKELDTHILLYYSYRMNHHKNDNDQSRLWLAFQYRHHSFWSTLSFLHSAPLHCLR